MKKIIFLLIITIICSTGAGCKTSKEVSAPQNNVQNSVSPSVSIAPSASPAVPSPAPSISPSPAAQNYGIYDGTWVRESALKSDYQYGLVLFIKAIGKDGNIEGTVSDSTENLSHIANLDFKGKIKDNKFNMDFQEDGWGHSGTLNLDFKDKQVILTIKYTSKKDSTSLWGIGEGTFPLISNSTKVTRTLKDLKNGGLMVIDNQSFPVNFENFGNVKFISGSKREDVNTIVVFYLVDSKENVVYKFPDFYGSTKGMFDNLAAVSFVDLNNDSKKDVVVVANYKYNINGSSASTAAICSVYFQKGNQFVNDKSLDDKMNKELTSKTVKEVTQYIKNNPHN